MRSSRAWSWPRPRSSPRSHGFTMVQGSVPGGGPRVHRGGHEGHPHQPLSVAQKGSVLGRNGILCRFVKAVRSAPTAMGDPKQPIRICERLRMYSPILEYLCSLKNRVEQCRAFAQRPFGQGLQEWLMSEPVCSAQSTGPQNRNLPYVTGAT